MLPEEVIPKGCENEAIFSIYGRMDLNILMQLS